MSKRIFTGQTEIFQMLKIGRLARCRTDEIQQHTWNSYLGPLYFYDSFVRRWCWFRGLWMRWVRREGENGRKF